MSDPVPEPEQRKAPDASAGDPWIRDLRAGGARAEQALTRLHALLLRACRYAVGRSRALSPQFAGDDLEQAAMEAADDATMAVLAHLHEFRGDSRFTTWAYKFALLQASANLRRRAWQVREIPTEPESWTVFAPESVEAERSAEVAELLRTIAAGIADALTKRQRDVLVAVAMNGVPIEVVAARLETTRGAVYKTLHEARTKLRAYLADHGLRPLDDS